MTMAPANSNESYCTFTLPSDVAAGGLPSQEEIAKDLESNDTAVCFNNNNDVSTLGNAHECMPLRDQNEPLTLLFLY